MVAQDVLGQQRPEIVSAQRCRTNFWSDGGTACRRRAAARRRRSGERSTVRRVARAARPGIGRSCCCSDLPYDRGHLRCTDTVAAQEIDQRAYVDRPFVFEHQRLLTVADECVMHGVQVRVVTRRMSPSHAPLLMRISRKSRPSRPHFGASRHSSPGAWPPKRSLTRSLTKPVCSWASRLRRLCATRPTILPPHARAPIGRGAARRADALSPTDRTAHACSTRTAEGGYRPPSASLVRAELPRASSVKDLRYVPRPASLPRSAARSLFPPRM